MGVPPVGDGQHAHSDPTAPDEQIVAGQGHGFARIPHVEGDSPSWGVGVRDIEDVQGIEPGCEQQVIPNGDRCPAAIADEPNLRRGSGVGDVQNPQPAQGVVGSDIQVVSGCGHLPHRCILPAADELERDRAGDVPLNERQEHPVRGKPEDDQPPPPSAT